MLTTEQRQQIQSLVNHNCISSVSVSDSKGFNGRIDSAVTIHATVDADRETVLFLLDSLVECTTSEEEPQGVRDNKRAIPYRLLIEGATSYLSYLYFCETEKEPSATESPNEFIQPDSTTVRDFETILRQEA